jgi:hypothetical protein
VCTEHDSLAASQIKRATYLKCEPQLIVDLSSEWLATVVTQGRLIFVQKLLRDNSKKLAVSFNHTFRYIDDVLSINNYNFHNYVHLIYPDALEIKDTTESDKSASYIDILLNIDWQTDNFAL